MAALLLEARRRRWRDDDALQHQQQQQHQHQHREDVVVVRRRRKNTSGVTMTLCAGLYVLVLLGLVGVTSAGSREERIVPRSSSCRLYIHNTFYILYSRVERDINYDDFDRMLASHLFDPRDCASEEMCGQLASRLVKPERFKLMPPDVESVPFTKSHQYPEPETSSQKPVPEPETSSCEPPLRKRSWMRSWIKKASRLALFLTFLSLWFLSIYFDVHLVLLRRVVLLLLLLLRSRGVREQKAKEDEEDTYKLRTSCNTRGKHHRVSKRT
ncbi:unnamed protein product [Trichogramma brassicae]|uniref:Uncharacterized protein n=1 Tax=Trichogramma brassicae TaxID=86971 RepID=A0A6H5INF3_9HYME|nr:unnamed protein product [Trichogramma brassicae]